MELNDTTLVTISEHLVKTLSPDPNIRKPAENFLLRIETQDNYSLCLLRLIDQENADMNVRVSAAITLKNFVKNNWRVPVDGENRIPANDRTKIKEVSLQLIMTTTSFSEKIPNLSKE